MHRQHRAKQHGMAHGAAAKRRTNGDDGGDGMLT